MEDHDSAIIIQDSLLSAVHAVQQPQSQAAQDLALQLGFLQRQDPFVIKIHAVSTFTAAYEMAPGSDEMRKLEPEGSLYLLERSCQPLFKMLLLNRKPRDDFTEWLDEET